jgi:hypothetical protein
MLTQMKRWGHIPGEVDYQSMAEQVYLATGTGKIMKDMGLTPPATSYKSFSVMGNPFGEARRIRRKFQDQEGILTWSPSPDRPHDVQPRRFVQLRAASLR